MTKLPRGGIPLLIGLAASVVKATNPSYLNKEGQIIDETHGTLTLDDGKHQSIITKDGAIFEIVLQNGNTIRLEGKSLLGHPVERLRRAKRKQW